MTSNSLWERLEFLHSRWITSFLSFAWKLGKSSSSNWRVQMHQFIEAGKNMRRKSTLVQLGRSRNIIQFCRRKKSWRSNFFKFECNWNLCLLHSGYPDTEERQTDVRESWKKKTQNHYFRVCDRAFIQTTRLLWAMCCKTIARP